MHRTLKTLVSKNSGLSDLLRAARPRLILRVNTENGNSFGASPCISEVEYNDAAVVDEGYDPYYSPLGCPVYWRIVNRRDGKFYYRTFQVPLEYVLKVWGARGLTHCDPITGKAVARIETRLPKEEPSEDRIVGDVREAD